MESWELRFNNNISKIMKQIASKRIVRTKRLLEELGHEDTFAALEQALKMRTALRVLYTWSGVDGACTQKEVRELCKKALKID